MKFVTAVSLNPCMILCLTETWLTANIGDSELYLCNFNIYRSEREPTEEGASRHGGALIAVNKNIKSEQLNLELPNCCVAVQLQLLKPIVLCVFYNPPRGSTYRYTFEDFNILVNSLLKKKTPIVVCGYINFPSTNWDTNQSIDTEENNMLNELDRLNAEQVIRFPTCGRKTLDVVFAEDLVVNAQIDEKFESCYNRSDHRPVSFDFYISMRKPKPLHDCCYSYGSANYDEIRTYMSQNPFRPECFTNINRMNKEFIYINSFNPNLWEDILHIHFIHL